MCGRLLYEMMVYGLQWYEQYKEEKYGRKVICGYRQKNGQTDTIYCGRYSGVAGDL